MKTKKKRPVSFARQLRLLGACDEAREWAGKKTLTQAWRTCKRPDWMLWLLELSNGWKRKTMNECLIDIIADALESARPVCSKEAYWAQVEASHRQVVEALRGNGDLDAAGIAAEAAEAAANAAARAARAANAASAARAANAASAAAGAAGAAARAARDAARDAAGAAGAAARAAWDAARDAAGATAWDAANQRLADIVRKHFPKAPKLKEPKL